MGFFDGLKQGWQEANERIDKEEEIQKIGKRNILVKNIPQ